MANTKSVLLGSQYIYVVYFVVNFQYYQRSNDLS